jgi:hypothetical protein
VEHLQRVDQMALLCSPFAMQAPLPSITALFCLIGLLSTGCSITKRVRSVPPGTKIQTIHIIENADTLYKQSLLEEMRAILAEAGCNSEVVSGSKPDHAQYHMEYRANWQWDLAMYLTYFRATLYEQNRVIGEVEYDSRSGGGRLDKFGATTNKIRPLLKEMLKDLDRSSAPPFQPLTARASSAAFQWPGNRLVSLTRSSPSAAAAWTGA